MRKHARGASLVAIGVGEELVKHLARPRCPAYRQAVPDDPDGDLVAARRALSVARTELDEAVAAVPQIDGQEAIASPELLALLFRAVKAKHHLDDVLSASSPGIPRP